jgi:poly-gamma-glutamate capsule biosynthesis protein CapA/YwtB (metallophosphatase superfamily)
MSSRPNGSPTIGLLGDVMLGREVGKRLAAVDPAELWSPPLRDLLAGCDAVVCNLECCISDRGLRTRAIPGKPFFFRGPPKAVGALTAAGVSVAGLANNHALDFGAEALADTAEHLRLAGIAAVGAGPDDRAARRGAIVVAGGRRVGVLALSDHPRQYAAAASTPGIAYAPLSHRSPDWALRELARLRQEADSVIAFPHWGPNMSVRPAPGHRTRADDFLRAGADIVVGHSAHVFHGIESRPGGFALYDLGGALDDYAVDRDLRNDLGVLALWRPGAPPGLELVGLKLEFCHTTVADGPDADWIHGRLERACGELGSRVERTEVERFAVHLGA